MSRRAAIVFAVGAVIIVAVGAAAGLAVVKVADMMDAIDAERRG